VHFQFAETFRLGVTMERLMRYFEDTLLPYGVLAHQLPGESSDSAFLSFLKQSVQVLNKEEVL
jgi:hypothetical protein